MPIDGALGLAQPLLAGTRGRNPPGMGEKGKKGSVPLAAPLPGLSGKGWLCLIALGTAAGAGLGPGRDESPRRCPKPLSRTGSGAERLPIARVRDPAKAVIKGTDKEKL